MARPILPGAPLVAAPAKKILLLLFQSLLNEILESELGEGGEQIRFTIHSSPEDLLYLFTNHP